MSGDGVSRRDFLQAVGLGGTTIALAGCGHTSIESGVELVESYVQPENFVVPGVGVSYASTCTQCASACAIMGRVREGRILKLEGNPESAISGGKICGLGQAAVQQHYSPDRLTTPMIRDGGSLRPTSWDKAMALLNASLAPAERTGRRVWLTGPTSGHQQILLHNLVGAGAATDYIVYDPLSTAVESSVNRKLFGVDSPVGLIEKAGLVLSFGDDFLGAGASPVAAARQYARFRRATPRGVLVQIEPKMTLTGANADRWIVIAPGTEGVFALGLARELLQRKDFAGSLSPALVAAVDPYTQAEVSRITGVYGELIPRLAAMLWERAPSLVLAGRYPQGHSHGSHNTAAIALLNVVLQNNGKTLMRSADLPFPQLAPTNGDFKSLADLNKSMADGNCRSLLMHGTNPVYSAPDFLQFTANLRKVPFKAAWVTEMDETAMECDLVLPLLSPLEDFGTHVATNQFDGTEISIQQPLMEKLYPETRSFGDVLLDLLRQAKPDSYKLFPDYYAYLKSAVINAKPAFPSEASGEEFWENTLSAGVLHRPAPLLPLPATDLTAEMIQQPATNSEDAEYPFHLIPAVSPSMRDGRPANLSWLQESPDPLTTIVWDSWAELHPSTAKALQISEGDVLIIESAHGFIRVKAYLMPGIHPGSVAVPIGQGHTAYGRYATNVGANPLKILDPIFDQETGELAIYATRVAIRKTGQNERVVKDEGPTNLQQGVKLVATLAADRVDLSKETKFVIR
ncbi:MAG: molybdopterin-dependent oxidoreductase [Steroidobacteraceae bacterium]|jgi:anaerobic selenocysteine-containing dehydrogenase